MLLCSVLFAQKVGYVNSEHNIYDFLDRMNRLDFISKYDEFKIPKTISEISKHLIELSKNKSQLNNVDAKILNDYLIEFEYSINNTSNNYVNFYSELKLSHFNNEKEKFLYNYADSNFSIFANFVGEFEQYFKSDFESEKNTNSTLVNYGFQIKGDILGNFGFYAKATNGTFAGNKALTFEKKNLRYNYKYTSDPELITATDFFDQTEGYISADFDYIQFKLGRDRNLIGYGIQKSLLSAFAPELDYFSLDMNYKSFNYSYIHGKLLGEQSIVPYNDDSKRVVKEKYFVYHRMGFDFSKHFRFGLGEIVIYGERGIDLSYLNPFNFYKSIEHSNRDRDNSAMFLDFKNNTIKGLELSGTILIDDIDFGKLGTGWYGNKLMYDFSLNATLFYNWIPVDLMVQYIRIEPYTFTHRYKNNSYASQNIALNDPLEPNSDSYILSLSLDPTHRMKLLMNYKYSRHGSNLRNNDSEVIFNAGGNINLGHRKSDSDNVNFLDGDLEYRRETNFSIILEPINNYFVVGSMTYRNNDLSDYKENEILTKFQVKVKF